MSFSAFARPSAEMSPALHEATSPLHVPSRMSARSAFQRAHTPVGDRSLASGGGPAGGGGAAAPAAPAGGGAAAPAIVGKPPPGRPATPGGGADIPAAPGKPGFAGGGVVTGAPVPAAPPRPASVLPNGGAGAPLATARSGRLIGGGVPVLTVPRMSPVGSGESEHAATQIRLVTTAVIPIFINDAPTFSRARRGLSRPDSSASWLELRGFGTPDPCLRVARPGHRCLQNSCAVFVARPGTVRTCPPCRSTTLALAPPRPRFLLRFRSGPHPRRPARGANASPR